MAPMSRVFARRRPHRACPGGAMILHYRHPTSCCAAPAELVSVERTIAHWEFLVANHGLHRDKLGGGLTDPLFAA